MATWFFLELKIFGLPRSRAFTIIRARLLASDCVGQGISDIQYDKYLNTLLCSDVSQRCSNRLKTGELECGTQCCGF